MNKNFNMVEMPQAYFSGNVNADNNRKQLIKNIFKQPECNINILTDVFFSKENIELINKQLVMTVYKKSVIELYNACYLNLAKKLDKGVYKKLTFVADGATQPAIHYIINGLQVG